MSEIVFEVATDRNAVWLNGRRDEQREQVANRARLVGTKRRYIQLYRVPPGTQPWEKPDVDELIQATGTDGRMTVELFRLEGNEIRGYVVGRTVAGDDAVPSESVFNGANEYRVLPSEVWSPDEMTELLLRYHEAGGALDTTDLALREQEEFRRVVDKPTNAGNVPVVPVPTVPSLSASGAPGPMAPVAAETRDRAAKSTNDDERPQQSR